MSVKKESKKLQKLKNKYRLVILNDDTFEEKISLRLSRLNVFTIVGLISLTLITLVIILIAFTPLRELIPGYANVRVREEGIRNTLRADSMLTAIEQKDRYISNLKHIIQGNPITLDQQKVIDSNINYQHIDNTPISEDSILRSSIESEEKYNLFPLAESVIDNMSNFIFFSPLKGTITSAYDIEKQHFGIDIVAPKNETIKATLDGTVIFTGWDAETGYVIQLQHQNNLVSVYKHNAVLYKKTGDHVKAGEVIAIVGNTGKLSTGPHLHFELWYNGIPLNPEEYMVF